MILKRKNLVLGGRRGFVGVMRLSWGKTYLTYLLYRYCNGRARIGGLIYLLDPLYSIGHEKDYLRGLGEFIIAISF